MLTILEKAAKTLATNNIATLNRTHIITAALHALFHLLRYTILSSSKRTFLPYLLLTAPALALEIFLDRSSRPKYTTDSDGVQTLRTAGEDLEAKGLTEYFWDVIYWTWINLGLVILFGNRAWWLYIVVPAYSVYTAATTIGGVKGMLQGMGGAGADGAPMEVGAQSKREAKREKRGQGQRVTYGR